MIFEEKTIILKDGRTAILKSPCVEDAEKLLNYIKKSCSETDFLARYPEEWTTTIGQEEAWVNRLRSAPDTLGIPDWERFVQAMNYAMMKQFSALEKGGRMAVLMGDIKKKGKLYSMIAEIVKPGTMENIIIKAQHNCFSDNTQYSGTFIPILHEYVLIVRKDSPTAIPVLMCTQKTMDIRDMPGATWRDVVAAVLEDCDGAVSLTYLYEQIEPHKKAQANKWWKEKIRQTLQCNPEHFNHDGRGLWSLRTAV